MVIQFWEEGARVLKRNDPVLYAAQQSYVNEQTTLAIVSMNQAFNFNYYDAMSLSKAKEILLELDGVCNSEEFASLCNIIPGDIISLFNKIIQYYIEIDDLQSAEVCRSRLEKILVARDHCWPDIREKFKYLSNLVSLSVATREEKTIFSSIKKMIYAVIDDEETRKQYQDDIFFQELNYKLGIVLLELDELEEAEKVLLYSRGSDFLKEDKVKYLCCLSNLGAIYQQSQAYEKAVQYFCEALEVNESLPLDKRDHGIGYVYNALGAVFRYEDNQKRDLDSSFEYYRLCIRYYENVQEELRTGRYPGWAYFGLARIFVEKKEVASAEDCLRHFIAEIDRLGISWEGSYLDFRGQLESDIRSLQEECLDQNEVSQHHRAVESVEKEFFLDINKFYALKISYHTIEQRVALQLINFERGREVSYRNLLRLLSIRFHREDVEEEIELSWNDKFIAHFSAKLPSWRMSLYMADVKFIDFHVDAATIVMNVFNKLTVSQTRRLNDCVLSRPTSWLLQTGKYCISTDLHTHFDAILPSVTLLDVVRRRTDVTVHFATDILRKLGIINPESCLQASMPYQNIAISAESLSRLQACLAIPCDRTLAFVSLEDIYYLRDFITGRKEFFADFLTLIADQYKEQGIDYAELSMNCILDPEWLQIAHAVLPEIEKRTGVKIRFLVAIYHYESQKKMMNDIHKLAIASRSHYIVGVDFAGHEWSPNEKYLDCIRSIAKWISENQHQRVMRIHAGETNIHSDNLKNALIVAEEFGVFVRIGHGIYGIEDSDTLLLMSNLAKKDSIIVEFNPDSNIALGMVDELSALPVLICLERKIPFVIGSDGSGIYQTSAEQLILSMMDVLSYNDRTMECMGKIMEFINTTESCYKERQMRRPQATVQEDDFFVTLKREYEHLAMQVSADSLENFSIFRTAKWHSLERRVQGTPILIAIGMAASQQQSHIIETVKKVLMTLGSIDTEKYHFLFVGNFKTYQQLVLELEQSVPRDTSNLTYMIDRQRSAEDQRIGGEINLLRRGSTPTDFPTAVVNYLQQQRGSIIFIGKHDANIMDMTVCAKKNEVAYLDLVKGKNISDEEIILFCKNTSYFCAGLLH